jgi:hypothetical protein
MLRTVFALKTASIIGYLSDEIEIKDLDPYNPGLDTGDGPMKRTELVALTRAAIERLTQNKVGVIRGTKRQLEMLAKHKKKKEHDQHQGNHSHRAAS